MIGFAVGYQPGGPICPDLEGRAEITPGVLGKVVIEPEGRPQRRPRRRAPQGPRHPVIARRVRLARMSDPYADFPALTFDRPSDGVLRITLDAPGLNAVGPAAHGQLADVWRVVDRDPGHAGGAAARAPARGSRPAGASS